MLFRIWIRAVALALSCTSIFSVQGAAAEPVRVFAAASLTQPLSILIEQLPDANGVFASSGTLTRQIESGAPADIFISAHPRWSDYLIDKGIVAATAVTPYATNSLVMVTTDAGHGVNADFAFDRNSLDRLLSSRLAIGDPAHVPAGQYAVQALQHLGIWSDLQSTVIRAGNVRAVVAYVKQHAVGYGIVYRSDAITDAGLAVVAQIPSGSHDPIVYTIALLSERPEARLAYQQLINRNSMKVLQEYGFTPASGAY